MTGNQPSKLPPEIVAVMRQMLLARRRVLLAEVADIERLLSIGRYAGQEAPLAEAEGAEASERVVDWLHPEVQP